MSRPDFGNLSEEPKLSPLEVGQSVYTLITRVKPKIGLIPEFLQALSEIYFEESSHKFDLSLEGNSSGGTIWFVRNGNIYGVEYNSGRDHEKLAIIKTHQNDKGLETEREFILLSVSFNITDGNILSGNASYSQFQFPSSDEAKGNLDINNTRSTFEKAEYFLSTNFGEV